MYQILLRQKHYNFPGYLGTHLDNVPFTENLLTISNLMMSIKNSKQYLLLK